MYFLLNMGIFHGYVSLPEGRSNYASLRKKIYGYQHDTRYNMFHGKKDAVKRPPNTRRQLNTPWKFDIYTRNGDLAKVTL